MKTVVDINADAGEGYGNLRSGDARVIALATSINAACGFHGGDPTTMRKTILAARDNNVAVGAHPSFPDLMGFGRRPMKLAHDELVDIIVYQVSALKGMLAAEGMKLQHVKPHGALYTTAVSDRYVAAGICDAIAKMDKSLILVCPQASEMARVAEEMNLRVAYEAFIDRRYEKKGNLAPRNAKGAVIENPADALAQLGTLVREGSVKTIDGYVIPVEFHSLSVHSDTPNAYEIISLARKRLRDFKIEVKPLGIILGNR